MVDFDALYICYLRKKIKLKTFSFPSFFPPFFSPFSSFDSMIRDSSVSNKTKLVSLRKIIYRNIKLFNIYSTIVPKIQDKKVLKS